MATIIAKGLLRGSNQKEEVKCDDMKIYIDGKRGEDFDEVIKMRARSAPAMGGTFYPEPDTMLSAYNILKTVWFDKLISIDVIGDIGTIPYEEGVIY